MARSLAVPPARLAVLAALLLVMVAGCGRSSPPASPSSSDGTTAVISAILDLTADLLDVTIGYTGTDNWAGQSVTIPGSGSYNNLRFNWYHYNPAATPTAFGTLYLLTQEYAGLPSNLGPTTPGFVARSETVKDRQYVFPAGATVVGGRRYWFYCDTRGQFTYSFNKDVYAGGDLYATGYPTNPFSRSLAGWLRLPSGEYLKPAPGTGVDANFKLQGAVVQ
jgi:hypothetical protein